MIYDNKETIMEAAGALTVNGQDSTEMLYFETDLNGIEEGRRYLAIPEGILRVAPGAFNQYNNSGIVLAIQNKLVQPDYARQEWLKNLKGNRTIKITFPPEAGKTYFERAEFMRKKELRGRFLRLLLPASVREVTPESFPLLLEKIVVHPDNECYASEDGVLYTRDRKTLVRYPGYRDEAIDFTVPENVRVLRKGAFTTAVIGRLVIPDNVETIEEGCFSDCVFDELVLPPHLESIEEGMFENCDIRRLVLPAGLRRIGDYAFRGIAGVSSLECAQEEESIDFGVGIFSDSYMKDVQWWPWKRVPVACFLNSWLKAIHLPEGVEIIDDYAFAGCYQAKEVTLPGSVREVGPDSFDLGDTFSGAITVPEALLHLTYRFPALSRINGLRKGEAWRKRTEREYKELPAVLEKQKAAMEKYIGKLGVIQSFRKNSYKEEVRLLDKLLEERKEKQDV